MDHFNKMIMNNIFYNKIKFFLFLFLVFSTFSCKTRKFAKIFPNSAINEFRETLAVATPEFRQGWDDGCETGSSAGANTFYKTLYKSNAVDGYKMVSSPEYKVAWGNGFWYCYRYTDIKQGSSLWGSYFTGYR